MKQINVWFEDNEHAALSRAKGKESWHDFILRLTKAELHGVDSPEARHHHKGGRGREKGA